MDGAAIPALTESDARASRWAAQLLDRSGAGTVVDTVRALGAVQAQLPQSAALCLRARTTGLCEADVEAARVGERSVVRTWVMRGTLHLVPAEDLGWLLALYEPVHRANTDRRYRELKLTDDDLRTGVHVIREQLTRHGPLDRREIAEHLASAGIDPSGQRLIHLINRAAMRGVLCHGPNSAEDDPCYVLVADWLGAGWEGRPRERAAALAELALRYARAYGPVAPVDFGAWAGLPLSAAREAFRLVGDALVELPVDGQPAWSLPAHAGPCGPPRGVVRLLPSFDTYMLGGYLRRELIVPSEHQRTVWTGGGWIKPTLVVDAVAVATWSTDRRRDATRVAVHPFRALTPAERAGLDAEVSDLGRFLDVPTYPTVGDRPRPAV